MSSLGVCKEWSETKTLVEARWAWLNIVSSTVSISSPLYPRLITEKWPGVSERPHTPMQSQSKTAKGNIASQHSPQRAECDDVIGRDGGAEKHKHSHQRNEFMAVEYDINIMMVWNGPSKRHRRCLIVVNSPSITKQKGTVPWRKDLPRTAPGPGQVIFQVNRRTPKTAAVVIRRALRRSQLLEILTRRLQPCLVGT